jgi:uncharacterized membrane protein
LKTSAAPPPLTLWLAPLPDLLWKFFLVWTAVGFVVLPLDIGQSQLERWISHPGLREAASAILRGSDAFWIALAAVNVYLYTASAEGLGVARRWAVIILAGSAVCEWIGARTGFPFGPYRYTDRFGWRVGGVLPFTIPLAWLIILLCGRYLTLRLRPEATRAQIALGTALAAVVTDFNLEFVAWKIRAYWIWYPGPSAPPSDWPPPQNYVSWFALAFALAYALPPNTSLRLHRPPPTRPILILALMNALFFLTHAAHWARLNW